MVRPAVAGPVHRYMTSSPSCWLAYGEVLAREYGDPRYARLHRMTVDTYAVQHPGTESPQSIQSVGVHLCRLCLVLEEGFSIEHANEAMLAIQRVEGKFRWLQPPAKRGELTAADVLAATTPEEHLQKVEAWARSVWAAWTPYHATVRGWLPTGLTRKA